MDHQRRHRQHRPGSAARTARDQQQHHHRRRDGLDADAADGDASRNQSRRECRRSGLRASHSADADHRRARPAARRRRPHRHGSSGAAADSVDHPTGSRSTKATSARHPSSSPSRCRVRARGALPSTTRRPTAPRPRRSADRGTPITRQPPVCSPSFRGRRRTDAHGQRQRRRRPRDQRDLQRESQQNIISILACATIITARRDDLCDPPTRTFTR